MTAPIVSVENLSKSYGKVAAVADLTFAVLAGEVFGLLGPNGAGKTTTLECLEGLRRPDSGAIAIKGVDPNRHPDRLRSAIGVQLQTSGLPAAMTVREAMRFFCGYHHVAPRWDLLERLGLGAQLGAQYGSLSVGQQRRLNLALAVAHEPAVLFLDEPTAGLDVGSRAVLHAMIRELRSGGTTILLATHDMAEAERLADRVAILLAGRIAAQGTPRELTAAGSTMTRISVRTEAAVLARDGAVFPGVVSRHGDEEYTVYFTSDPAATVSALLGHIQVQGDQLVDLRVERPSLEERFLEITVGGN